MQLFLAASVDGDSISLSAEEARHCVKVLRHKAGDIIHIIDGKGNLFECELVIADEKKFSATILSKKELVSSSELNLHIAISPTKNADRIEWMLEKCTELGVAEFSFLSCQRTEKKYFKTGRLKKIAESAVKQSLYNVLPRINEAVPFKEFIQKHAAATAAKYIAYCENDTKLDIRDIKPAQKIIILIGPEGDFSPEEIKLAREKGYQSLSLGKARLRTETAALYIASILKVG